MRSDELDEAISVLITSSGGLWGRGVGPSALDASVGGDIMFNFGKLLRPILVWLI